VTLIKSISGIRGTIGGAIGNNLTPIDIVECVAGYGTWIKLQKPETLKVIVGRDGRISGSMVSELAINTLMSLGIDVIDLGLSTTPTVEMAVTKHRAAGGIIFTASHNPKQWNALKFLNHKGEFISSLDGQDILDLISKKEIPFSEIEDLGSRSTDSLAIEEHMDAILALDIIDIELIRKNKFHCIIDAINSTGAISIPVLLDKLGCTYEIVNEKVNGEFAHNPEPLASNLTQLIEKVKASKADIGIAVDPDVDRLALVCENGEYFGEEYTLVACADFVLSHTPGPTVSNLSSTKALKDVSSRYSCAHQPSMVGEVNVVNTMKESGAVIGGEGNGGVIYPPLHYGRDAFVGIAFILNLMAEKELRLSEIRQSYPDYTIIKNKIPLKSEDAIAQLFNTLKLAFANEEINTIDGLKIDFSNGWVHLRKSNTEPIIRVYAEAKNTDEAQKLIDKIMEHINE